MGWLARLKRLLGLSGAAEQAPPPIQVPEVAIRRAYHGGTEAAVVPAGAERPLPDSARLRRLMNQYLTLVELEQVAQQVDVAYAALPETKEGKVVGLIVACEQRGALPALAAACAAVNDAVDWAQVAERAVVGGGKRPSIDAAYLRQQMMNHLDEAQLAQVAEAIGVSYASLAGGKGRRVLALQLAAEQQRRVADLLAACERANAAVDWRGRFGGGEQADTDERG
ncbi:MAG: hypothetical protein KC425_00260 [Anaerolineales bacterium]|nr:hypothetical protein [Anaerolineales bacterium]